MFHQIFLSPQVKQWAIITYKHGDYYLQVTSRVAERFKIRKLGNIREVCKLHRMMA